MEKHGLYLIQNIRSRKINGSTLFIIDNMYHVNFKIQEQESVPWCNEIQNQRLEVLRNTLNLHSNSTCAQEVWSLNQYICMCSGENKRVAYTYIHTIFSRWHTHHFILLQNFICFSPYNWLSNCASLLDHSNWALVCGLQWDQMGTNKTLAPMGFRVFLSTLEKPKITIIYI